MVEVKKDPRLLPTWKEFHHLPTFVRWLTYLLTLGVLYMMLTIVGSVVTFEPMKFKNYTVLPTTVCPGTPVEVEYTAKYDGSRLYTLDSLSGSAYWLYPKNGKPYDSIIIDPYDIEYTPEYKAYESQVQRVAPLTPGEWKVGATFYVKGKVFGLIPRTQKLEVVSQETTTVKHFADNTCFNN